MVRARERADRRRGAPERSRRGACTAFTPSRCAAARSSRRAGDPSLTCFMRSSSKPLQALPLVRARDDLPDDELAIACASHHDTPEQVAAARALLARAEATEDDLELGPQEGRPPREDPQQLLGQARRDARALPRARLADAGLPPARASGAAGLPRRRTPRRPRSSRSARDRHRRLRRRHLRAHARADGARVLAPRVAARRRPESRPRCARVRTSSAAPTAPTILLMRAAPGWLAKGGAEGLLCAAGPDGTRRRAQDRGRREPCPRAGARGLPRRARRRPAGACAQVRSQQPRRARRRDRHPCVDKFFTNCQVLTSIRLAAIEGGPGRGGERVTGR